MALESSLLSLYIKTLNGDGSHPASSDFIATGPSHFALIKSTIKNTFPNVNGTIHASDTTLTNTAYYAAGGTANAITIPFSPALLVTTPVDGQGCIFRATGTNTSAVTIQLAGNSAASPIVGASGQALVGGEIQTGSIYRITYSSTLSSYVLQANDGYTKVPNVVIAGTTNASIKNTGTGTLILGTNANNNLTLNSDGSITTLGNATISGNLIFTTYPQSSYAGATSATGFPFPIGTALPFYQASAPTGWTQVTTLNDYMMRVVNVVGGTTGSGGTGGGGYGGSMSPTTMTGAQVPNHTHTFTTGTESATHTHTDSGHVHAEAGFTGNTAFGSNGYSFLQGGASGNNTGTGYAALGTETATHTHSGTTATNGSTTNWTPQYANFIICTKN
jgi:hypothetical protein